MNTSESLILPTRLPGRSTISNSIYLKIDDILVADP